MDKVASATNKSNTNPRIEQLLRDVTKIEGTTVEEAKRRLDLLAADVGMTGEEWVTKVAEYIESVRGDQQA